MNYTQNDWRYYSSDVLYHHGILGQKWGKKQGPPYPLDASDHSAAERKAGWKQSLEGVKKNITGKLYGDKTIRRGMTMRRITTDMNESLNNEHTFVNYKKGDVKLYQNYYPAQLKAKGDQKYVYEKEYQLKDNLKVAGKKSYEKVRDKVIADYQKKTGDRISSSDFDKHIQDRDRQINKDFFDEMKKRGYDAITDQASKVRDKTKDPLIILDPKEAMTEKKTNVIISNAWENKRDVNDASSYKKTSEKGNEIKKNITRTGSMIGSTTARTALTAGAVASALSGLEAIPIAVPLLRSTIGNIGSDYGKKAAESIINTIGEKKISTVGNNYSVGVEKFLHGLSNEAITKATTKGGQHLDSGMREAIANERARRESEGQ